MTIMLWPCFMHSDIDIDELRGGSCLLPVFTAVHKHVVFPGVSMKITVDGDAVVVLQQLCYQGLDVIHRGEGLSILTMRGNVCFY